MKINLAEISSENFMVHPHMIAGEVCYLVQPVHIGAKWDKDNLIFRSSLWNSSGELISASYKKFFNFGEQPDLTYTPFSLTANGGCQVMEKIDGSTLIISKYKGQLIIRTRGTSDATKQDNGYEIEVLKQKYPKAFEFADETTDVSYIYEWVSPSNRIVLDYGAEPDMYLTGIICHKDYTLVDQDTLDNYAKNILYVKRPKRYEFDSVKGVLNAVAEFKGVEGVCIYCNKGQDIRKVKSVEYLAAHKLRSELGSFEKVMDFWFAIGCPSYQETEKYLNEKFDFEIFTMCRGDISRICGAQKEVDLIIESMAARAHSLRSKPRKEAALAILQAYGQTNRASMTFKLLDGKNLDDDDKKKLFYQVLKK